MGGIVLCSKYGNGIHRELIPQTREPSMQKVYSLPIAFATGRHDACW